MSTPAAEQEFAWRQATTGDLILFSGRNPAHRRVQKWAGSPWSQIAIVLCVPQLREPCVLSATSLPICPDIETGALRTGVSTTSLSLTAQAFDGDLCLCRLRPALTPDLIGRLLSFRGLVVGRPFDFSELSFRQTIRRSHASFTPNVFMCASLVAFAYQFISVLSLPPVGPLPNNTWPCDFAPEGRIKLASGYSLYCIH
jgi:hypothetical protein